MRLRGTLIALLLMSISCGSQDATQLETPPLDLKQLLALGPASADTPCDSSHECASGVCTGFCVGLADAGQTWMESEIAAQIRSEARRRPAILDELAAAIPALEQEDPFRRGRVAGMLGMLGDPRFIPVLDAWSQSPIERVRVRALLALGRLGHLDSFDTVRALLQHRSESIRLEATEVVRVYATRKSTQDVATATLVELLQNDSYRVRQRAIRMLGTLETQPPAAIEALGAVVTADEDGYLRYDALRALGAQ